MCGNFKFQAQNIFFGRLGDLKNESHFPKKKAPLVGLHKSRVRMHRKLGSMKVLVMELLIRQVLIRKA